MNSGLLVTYQKGLHFVLFDQGVRKAQGAVTWDSHKVGNTLPCQCLHNDLSTSQFHRSISLFMQRRVAADSSKAPDLRRWESRGSGLGVALL